MSYILVSDSVRVIPAVVVARRGGEEMGVVATGNFWFNCLEH
jgi:hypothetical protein